MSDAVLFNCAETSERFLAYLDGELPVAEARTLELHLECCPPCRREADSLSELHRDLSQRAAELECMEADPIPAILAKSQWDEAAGARRRRRRLARREGPSRAMPWIVAAAAACLLIAVASLVRSRPAAPSAETPSTVAEHAPAPSEAAPPAPSPGVPVEERTPARGTFPPLPPTVPEERTPRVPDPAPEPKEPRPETKPARPAPRPTIIAVARIASVTGDVALGGSKAAAGGRIAAGDRLVTTGADGRARIIFPDGTRIQIGGDATVTFVTEKRFELGRGALLADVAPQPKGNRLVIATPRADVKVLGTRLKVVADPDATRVGVEKGRVRVIRRRDGWGVFVSAGFQTLVAAGVPFKAVPRPRNLLVNPGFESGTQSWKWPLPTVADPVRTGSLCQKIPAQKTWIETWQSVDVRPGASYSASTWIRTEELQGRGAALRIVWLDAAGQLIHSEDFGWVNGSRGWTKVTGRAAAPANAARMQFMVFIDGEPDGSGAAWFDDCELIEPVR